MKKYLFMIFISQSIFAQNNLRFAGEIIIRTIGLTADTSLSITFNAQSYDAKYYPKCFNEGILVSGTQFSIVSVTKLISNYNPM